MCGGLVCWGQLLSPGHPEALDLETGLRTEVCRVGVSFVNTQHVPELAIHRCRCCGPRFLADRHTIPECFKCVCGGIKGQPVSMLHTVMQESSINASAGANTLAQTDRGNILIVQNTRSQTGATMLLMIIGRTENCQVGVNTFLGGTAAVCELWLGHGDFNIPVLGSIDRLCEFQTIGQVRIVADQAVFVIGKAVNGGVAQLQNTCIDILGHGFLRKVQIQQYSSRVVSQRDNTACGQCTVAAGNGSDRSIALLQSGNQTILINRCRARVTGCPDDGFVSCISRSEGGFQL